MFRPVAATKQFLCATKPFFAFGAELRKRPIVIKLTTKRREAPAAETGDSQMRTLSFVLTFAFVLAGPSIVGSSEASLPGVGTFAYSGSPVVTSAPQTVVVAALNGN
jgi:hypothetical protein